MTGTASELEVAGLTVRFGGVAAVDGLDLRIEPLTIHGLIGPNGAGKTTLLNALSGLVPIAAGSVRFEGRDITRVRASRRPGLGIGRTFQNPALIDGLSAVENVMTGVFSRYRSWPLEDALLAPRSLRREREARARSLDALRELRIDVDLDAPVENLPLGARKLVDLARAWALFPRLLLMDEPTSGISGAETMEIERVLQQVKGKTTVVVIAHHLEFILNLADRITVLDFGRKVAEGPPDEIRRDPKVIEVYIGEQAEAPA